MVVKALWLTLKSVLVLGFVDLMFSIEGVDFKWVSGQQRLFLQNVIR